MKKLLIISIFSLVSSLFALCEAQYNVLHNFNDTLGQEPTTSSLILSGNVLYGMVYTGGANNKGCIFSMDTSGKNYKDLLDFNSTNGALPGGSLTLSGNKLFGMTSQGGTNYGCVFSIDTNGTGYRNLHKFNGTNGANPYGSLTLLGNKLFGMTNGYSSLGDSGTIFSIDTNGTGFKTILTFHKAIGVFPWGDLTLSVSGKVLYGMTWQGGANGDGVVFSIDTNGNNYKDLLDFNGTNGQGPYGSLTLLGNKLYGMTNGGGVSSRGLIFSLDTNGGSYKDLLNFNGTNGQGPEGSLLLSGPTMFGMTGNGGPNNGVLFSIDTSGSGYQDLFNCNTDSGFSPLGSLILSGNVLYGLTQQGGKYDAGVIFSFKDTAIHITGVNTISAGTGLKVYPNPSNGIFNIVENGELKNENQTIEVYNLIGEQVYSQKSTFNSQLTINLNNQPSGIYLYRVLSENGNFIGEGKLIIQK
jgi:uncharacterized repeat protein (TIGR03803 family)